MPPLHLSLYVTCLFQALPRASGRQSIASFFFFFLPCFFLFFFLSFFHQSLRSMGPPFNLQTMISGQTVVNDVCPAKGSNKHGNTRRGCDRHAQTHMGILTLVCSLSSRSVRSRILEEPAFVHRMRLTPPQPRPGPSSPSSPPPPELSLQPPIEAQSRSKCWPPPTQTPSWPPASTHPCPVNTGKQRHILTRQHTCLLQRARLYWRLSTRLAPAHPTAVATHTPRHPLKPSKHVRTRSRLALNAMR